jgi:hypothetical protein
MFEKHRDAVGYDNTQAGTDYSKNVSKGSILPTSG